MGVVVVVGDGKAQLVLLPVYERTKGLSQWCGTSSPVWKQGPLAPVVVVGEGQAS